MFYDNSGERGHDREECVLLPTAPKHRDYQLYQVSVVAHTGTLVIPSSK